MADAGEDGEKEMRFRGVRKRKWGKYVAEIRSGKRSRISLGSYFTPHGAARAYDTALLCLRGPNVTCFNFPDSQFNLEVANTETNPSPQAIRTAAIAVGSAYDVVPGGYFRDNNNQIFEDAANQEQPAQGGETINDQRNRLIEEKMAEEQVIYELTDAESHVQSAQRILSDQSIQTTFNFMI